jgi:hypothetical protein
MDGREQCHGTYIGPNRAVRSYQRSTIALPHPMDDAPTKFAKWRSQPQRRLPVSHRTFGLVEIGMLEPAAQGRGEPPGGRSRLGARLLVRRDQLESLLQFALRRVSQAGSTAPNIEAR